ncbi:ER membrane glycoprotein subunit of the GPI transamidase complex-like protein [Tulasnella sp. 403]|nr:ER membrane glycoprotein subunit of the GPI transamidase complex-like protein [Tulasnella sp. 403]
MNDTPQRHKRALRSAYLIARLATAIVIVSASSVLPAFDSSHLVTQPSPSLASSLLRWDAFHFSHIALHGYEQEHHFAFFPGTPMLMRLFAEAALWLARMVKISSRQFVNESDVLRAGALAAFWLCDWTADLYDLTLAVAGSPSFALLASLLSLLPLSPPSLLFAPYAEPFFTSLSYKGMLACTRKQWVKATVCFMLATAFRSNGVMLIGFLIWGLVVDPTIRKLGASIPVIDLGFFQNTLYALFLSVTTILPFALHQYHGYLRFCRSTAGVPHPTNITELRPWCEVKPFPLIYTFVQSHYWNVGLLRYWTVSQIPNFLFAAPVLVLIFATTITQLLDCVTTLKHAWTSAGPVTHREDKGSVGIRLRAAAKSLVVPEHSSRVKHVGKGGPGEDSTCTGSLLNRNWKVLPHAIHAFVLSCVLLFASHTQIALRLSSSMPYTYWAAASLVMKDAQDVDDDEPGRDIQPAVAEIWDTSLGCLMGLYLDDALGHVPPTCVKQQAAVVSLSAPEWYKLEVSVKLSCV